MVKATMSFPSGATAVLEGSPSDVAEFTHALGNPSSAKFGAKARKDSTPKRSSLGPKGRVKELKGEEFFKERRTIAT